jgi:hypothetical protein
MKSLLLVAAAGLALSGCQTLGLMTPLSPAHVNSLKAACATADQLYPTFKALVDGGVVKASVAKKGEYAYQVTRPLCATPANATYQDIIVATAQAAILAKILKDAE